MLVDVDLVPAFRQTFFHPGAAADDIIEIHDEHEQLDWNEGGYCHIEGGSTKGFVAAAHSLQHDAGSRNRERDQCRIWRTLIAQPHEGVQVLFGHGLQDVFLAIVDLHIGEAQEEGEDRHEKRARGLREPAGIARREWEFKSGVPDPYLPRIEEECGNHSGEQNEFELPVRCVHEKSKPRMLPSKRSDSGHEGPSLG